MEKENASKNENIRFYGKNANISYMPGFSIIRVNIKENYSEIEKVTTKKYLKTCAPNGIHRCQVLENVSYPE